MTDGTLIAVSSISAGSAIIGVVVTEVFEHLRSKRGEEAQRSAERQERKRSVYLDLLSAVQTYESRRNEESREALTYQIAASQLVADEELRAELHKIEKGLRESASFTFWGPKFGELTDSLTKDIQR
ncbi:hypothetical protein HUT18_18350 [Streptomyces sp. NA04227]|uniref:hypothetical protein n=1 Tax=Streptomyces sp. NA04227 TaxID=2742136 RepID=UPI00158FBB1F|nr:hypothetical protein [Streptomyces sp. NA04227]QKW08049.1 hypothetical protein HUT18_18350 [Streptomyces sp. NA04227]